MSDELSPSDFRGFFYGLHGYEPFPWQERLARRVCTGDWPAVLDLPTASGKTACLDVAVFAMAVKLSGPRRVFFVVDRRVVVDAAFERMQTITCKLADAKDGVLRTVADRLRTMALDTSPLDTYQMRGGIYRDESWVRSPLQPTLIASTVDQTGSRLLFRGYGVSDYTLPIHASLVANDALVFLDEAHCSRPFSETLRAVQKYRAWREKKLETPFAFVEMTATPGRDSTEAFHIEADDEQHLELGKRLYAPKPTKLIAAKARAKELDKFAHELATQALELARTPGIRRIAVMVNRVKTARLVYELLRERRAHLLIGRMRPVDRAPLPSDLEAMISGNRRSEADDTVFVVATQCLEVGADLDFDAVVTECASIDALVQRFGRLDRTGDLRSSGVVAQGRILMASGTKDEDPIYGAALSKTWAWLKSLGEEVDFGICSADGNSTVREKLAVAADAAVMRREAVRAPVLLPAHLDLLAQTSPRPAVEPDIHLYLHGIEDKGSPEVQVVWRGDLNGAPVERWGEIVALCPPVSAEAMPVPLREFRRWLTGDKQSADSSDVEGLEADTEGSENAIRKQVLRWLGDESLPVSDARAIQPGDTLILCTMSKGWDELGHKPKDGREDVAELARWQLRRRGCILRLHRDLIEHWPKNEARRELLEAAKGDDEDLLTDSLNEYRTQLDATAPAWLVEALKATQTSRPELYPGESPGGWVVAQRSAEPDSGQDESSRGNPVWLDRHLQDVTNALERMAGALVADEGVRESLTRAARLHDCGKADPRFQALLHGDPLAAQFAPRMLAKGISNKRRRFESELPDGFRHELVSLLLAEQDSGVRADTLALHLISSHHGRCRPFAPVVLDAGPSVSFDGWTITSQQRVDEAAHRLDSGVAERFWRLTKTYGWWGLAYLESLVRLADWTASTGDRP
jgi:CRISPR-associated endonuclease/helicase Cas3